jgi:hypothetical protein
VPFDPGKRHKRKKISQREESAKPSILSHQLLESPLPPLYGLMPELGSSNLAFRKSLL